MSKEADRSGYLQRESFLTGEGNQWFERNDSPGIAGHTQHALDRLLPVIGPDSTVLEIGCADGRNLAYLAQARPGMIALGVDPSQAAVDAARLRHPGVQTQQGTADRLPFADASCDIVCFGFCLYLVDRQLLFRTVSEADRVLRDRGFLAIIDFDPVAPRKRRYRHLPGLFSYKMDYSRPFVATGHYHMAIRSSYSHAAGVFSPDAAERVALTVLYKDVSAAYLVEED